MRAKGTGITLRRLGQTASGGVEREGLITLMRLVRDRKSSWRARLSCVSGVVAVLAGSCLACVVAETAASATPVAAVGVSASQPAAGYLLLTRGGGIYNFGNSPFHGSAAPLHPSSPVIAMTADPLTGGYWLARADGGVYSFNAPFYGSAAPNHPTSPIVAMAVDPATGGYWLTRADGGVYSFNAPFYGSAAPLHPGSAVVGTVPTAGGLEFDSPSGLVAAGGHLWVTNQVGDSVTEIDPASGAWVWTFGGAGFGFDQPTAITASGSDLFVANAGGFVTEMSAVSGAVIRTISGAQYGLSDPVAIVSDGNLILVLNGGASGSITEVNASTGAPAGIMSGAQFAFDDPVALTVNGSNVFVADEGNSSVTDVNLSSPASPTVITDPGLNAPDGITSGDGYVWVSDRDSNAATQIDAATGTVVYTYDNTDAAYGFGAPSVAIDTGGSAFIASPLGWSPMVTKLSDTSGAADWYMCNTNGPYYFSSLSAFAVDGPDLWVASSSGANDPIAGSATGSLTELSTTTGALVTTVPAR